MFCATVLFQLGNLAVHGQVLMPYAAVTVTGSSAPFSSDQTHERDKSSGTGLAIGALLEVEVNQDLYFETGLFLDQRKYRFEESARNEVYFYRETTRYRTLTLPVMFKWRTKLKSFEVGIKAGPVLSFGMSGSIEKFNRVLVGGQIMQGSSTGQIVYERYEASSDDRYFSRFFHPGLCIGFEGKLFKKFSVDVRYLYGLDDIEMVYAGRGAFRVLSAGVSVPLAL